MTGGKSSIKMTLLKVALWPMIIITVLVTVAGSYFIAKSLDEQVKEGMIDTCNTLLVAMNSVYPGTYSFTENEDGITMYKGDHKFNGDYSFFDDIKNTTECDVTLCYLKYVINTTLLDTAGNRMIGMTVNDEVAVSVLDRSESMFYEQAYIGSVRYYAYYVPIYDESGVPIGMLSVSMPADISVKLVKKALIPLVIISLIAILIVSFVVYKFSDEIVKVIRKVQKYMKQIANEDFRADIDPMVAKRTDELGQMAQSAVSMSNSLRKKVEEDQLTNLYNRRSADKKIKKTISDYVEKGVGFCLAIGDIDFFKKVNDTYGHEAGDDVLRAVSGAIKNFMVGKGYAIRWGGEEFILVYEGFSVNEAAREMDHLLDNVRALVIENNGNLIRVNMTFGLMECDPDDMESIPKESTDEESKDKALKNRMDSYISQADHKLYYGKEHGRNQLVIRIPDGNDSNEIDSNEN